MNTDYNTDYEKKLFTPNQSTDIQHVLDEISDSEQTSGSKKDKAAFSFRCSACGKCCQGEGSVYFTAQDLENIYSYLQYNNESQKKDLYKKLIQKHSNGYYTHEANGPCVLLDENKRCSVYPVRPLQCRTFPFWPSVFASPEDLSTTKKECPGISLKKEPKRETRPTFSAKQIATKINTTRKQFLAVQKDVKKRFII